MCESDEHVCEPERRLDYQLFHRREEIGGLEALLWDYFSSLGGRFELWDAARESRRHESGG